MAGPKLVIWQLDLTRIIQEHDRLSIIPLGVVRVGQKRRGPLRISFRSVTGNYESADLVGAGPLEVLMHPEPELEQGQPPASLVDYRTLIAQIVHPGDHL